MDREVVVQALGAIQSFVTPWNAAHQVSLYFTISININNLRYTTLMAESKEELRDS